MYKNFFVKGTMKTVLGLGISTTIGYGTLYYSFAIMSIQFQNEFQWSKSFIFGIFSLGILFGGLFSPFIGKLLDKKGARLIMTLGSFLCVLGLVFISFIENKIQYIFAIFYLEIVSTLVLYEAAFVAFSQLVGSKARLPMIQITLIAGFASTIFWPLINYLLTFISWRDVYLVLALFHIFIAMPIHFFLIKKNLLIDNTKDLLKVKEKEFKLEGKDKRIAMIYLAIVFSLIAIPVTVTQTHFVGMLSQFGIEISIAVFLGSLIGPSQVFARIVEIIVSKKATPIFTALFATFVMFLGFILLQLSGYSIYLSILFVILYGAGQGLSDIIRGSIPLYLFGRNSYGKTLGKLHLIQTIVVSSVPFVFASILDNIGVIFAINFLIVVTLVAFLLLIYFKYNFLLKKGFI